MKQISDTSKYWYLVQVLEALSLNFHKPYLD